MKPEEQWLLKAGKKKGKEGQSKGTEKGKAKAKAKAKAKGKAKCKAKGKAKPKAKAQPKAKTGAQAKVKAKAKTSAVAPEQPGPEQGLAQPGPVLYEAGNLATQRRKFIASLPQELKGPDRQAAWVQERELYLVGMSASERKKRRFDL